MSRTSGPGRERRGRSNPFYGWVVVAAGFVIYGFGVGPGYYSWGFFAPEVMADLGLSRRQVGDVFGAFTLTFAAVSPLLAAAIGRWGLRGVITAGSLFAVGGFWLMSRAESLAEAYVGYALLGGVGVGAAILPSQTLAVYWFARYRARATAIILTGAAVVGAVVTPLDDLVLRQWGWRTAWVMIAAASAGVALVAAIFVRERPEQLGQLPDGRDPSAPEPVGPELSAARAVATRNREVGSWTAAEAIRTPQFLIATFAALANFSTWRIFTAHGRIHFEDLGFSSSLAAAILGVRVGVSTLGRLTGSLGDFLEPTRVQSLALVVTALGLAGLLFADAPPLAYLSVALLGAGYGAGYTSVPVVFAYFFGRLAFVGSTGLQMAIIGVVGWLGPRWAGAAADRTGSYDGSFWVLLGICVVAAFAIAVCRPPMQKRHTPDAARG